jgi:hypothetical protein
MLQGAVVTKQDGDQLRVGSFRLCQATGERLGERVVLLVLTVWRGVSHAEAWAEDGMEYATVAMRFSALDVTRDRTGRVVEGDAAARSMITEIWTFARRPGDRWVLSAIQQTR